MSRCRGYLIDSAQSIETHPFSPPLSPSFVVVFVDGLAHTASPCWPCCHSNQEILTTVKVVVVSVREGARDRSRAWGAGV